MIHRLPVQTSIIRTVSCILCGILLVGCGHIHDSNVYPVPNQENLYSSSDNLDSIYSFNNNDIKDLGLMAQSIIENSVLMTVYEEESGIEKYDTSGWSIADYLMRDEQLYKLIEYHSSNEQQYSDKFELYKKNALSDESILIYESPPETYWINELTSNSTSLFWVEFQNRIIDGGDSQIIYQIVKMDKDGKKSIIAERDASIYDGICLEVSDEYLTWYDSVWPEGTTYGIHKIIIYDLKNNTFVEAEDGPVVKFMPYERLCQYDGGITYFTLDENDNLFVNRYNLSTREKVILAIGEKKDYPRIAGCFSTDEYIGWHTDYYFGDYYFYNFQSGEIIRYRDGTETNIFSKYCTGSYIYINDHMNSKIFKWNPFKSEASEFVFEDGMFGLQFVDNGSLFIEIRGENTLGFAVVPW